MQKEVARAFTTRFDGESNVLFNQVSVSSPKDGLGKGATGIWDTGASSTTITKSLVDRLGLKPVGFRTVRGVNSETKANTYLIDIHLPNQVTISELLVNECAQLHGGAEVLIGMDVILKGDFAVSNFKGKTTFTFRAPSQENMTFLKELTIKEKLKLAEQRKRANSKKGRK